MTAFKYFLFTDVFLLVGTMNSKKGKTQYIHDASLVENLSILEEHGEKAVVLSIETQKYNFVFEASTDFAQFKDTLNTQIEAMKKSKGPN